MRSALAAIAVAALLASDAMTLESTAGEVTGLHIGAPLQMRLEAYAAAQTAAINDLIDGIANCSAQYKFYGPGKPGADGNGCITPPNPVPAGTIAGFHMTSCPDGWTAYTQARGRMLVGYGSADGRSYSGIGGTKDTGGLVGRAQVRLTAAQLPNHHHGYRDYYSSRQIAADYSPETWVPTGLTYANRVTTSCTNCGNQAHENRPPFTVVLWCRKT